MSDLLDTSYHAREANGPNAFWKGASTLKQYFVSPKNGSKYYPKYTLLSFPVLGILGFGTPLGVLPSHISQTLDRAMHQKAYYLALVEAAFLYIL